MSISITLNELPGSSWQNFLEAGALEHEGVHASARKCGKQIFIALRNFYNVCARVINGRRKFHHIHDVFRDLPWLNIHSLSDITGSVMCI